LVGAQGLEPRTPSV